jgi:hypothetical protein
MILSWVISTSIQLWNFIVNSFSMFGLLSQDYVAVINHIFLICFPMCGLIFVLSMISKIGFGGSVPCRF